MLFWRIFWARTGRPPAFSLLPDMERALEPYDLPRRAATAKSKPTEINHPTSTPTSSESSTAETEPRSIIIQPDRSVVDLDWHLDQRKPKEMAVPGFHEERTVAGAAGTGLAAGGVAARAGAARRRGATGARRRRPPRPTQRRAAVDGRRRARRRRRRRVRRVQEARRRRTRPAARCHDPKNQQTIILLSSIIGRPFSGLVKRLTSRQVSRLTSRK